MAEPFVGEIKLWGTNFAPKGWAFCDGQVLAISSNQALFSLIGNTYGGDGVSNFALPDLRGRVATHAGTAPGMPSMFAGEMGGLEGVTLQTDQIPPHTHTMQSHNGEANVQSPNEALLASNSTTPLYAAADSSKLVEMEDETSVQGSEQSHMNIQPSTVMNYCIALVGLYPQRS